MFDFSAEYALSRTMQSHLDRDGDQSESRASKRQSAVPQGTSFGGHGGRILAAVFMGQPRDRACETAAYSKTEGKQGSNRNEECEAQIHRVNGRVLSIYA